MLTGAKEAWEHVNHMYHLVNQPDLAAKLNSYEALEVIDNFRQEQFAFTA